MKKALMFALLLVAARMGMCQSGADSEYYNNRYTELYKAYVGNPSDVETLLALSSFFYDKENPHYNLPQAMRYICKAEDTYVQWVNDDARYEATIKLLKKDINIKTIREQRQQIESVALAYVKANRSMDAGELTAFGAAFANTSEVLKIIQSKLIGEEYAQAQKENSIEGYYQFLTAYPGTAEAEAAEQALAGLGQRYFSCMENVAAVDSAVAPYAKSKSMTRAAYRQKSKIAYADACRLNTVAAYKDFMDRYQSSDEYSRALERVEGLKSGQYNTLKTAKQLADYAEANSDDPSAEQAMARLRKMILEDKDVPAAVLYLERFPLDPKHTDIFKLYYEWHAAEGNGKPIESFARKYPNYPFQMSLDADLKQAEAIDAVDLTRAFKEADFEKNSSTIYKLTGKKIAFVALQRILQHQLAKKDWTGALKRLRHFAICFETESNEEYRELESVIRTPAPKNVALAGEFLPEYDIRHAVAHPDGVHLYYSRETDGVSTIYVAERGDAKSGKWKSKGTVKVHNLAGEAVLYGFYDNGSRMVLGHDGDILIAERDGEDWRVSDMPPYPVNTDYVETDAYMLPDGSGMLLASDRPGGNNFQKSGDYFHGDHALASDIYYIPYTSKGWGEAVNLGRNVNTSYCDKSPVLSGDLKTLYYVTDGRGGMGYGDVYKVTRTDVDDWTNWSKPVNMGREVNSGMDEQSVSLSADERRLYVTSNTYRQWYGCHSVATNHTIGRSFRSLDVDLHEVSMTVSSIQVADLSKQVVVSVNEPSQPHDMLHLSLYRDKPYLVMAQGSSLFVPSLLVGAKESGHLEMKAYSMRQLVEQELALPLPAVTFAEGSAQPSPLAMQELDRLARFVDDNPDCVVEIEVNVAGRDDAQCYNLSLERAKSMRTYLVDYGINVTRVRLSGFGNAKKRVSKNVPDVSVRFYRQ